MMSTGAAAWSAQERQSFGFLFSHGAVQRWIFSVHEDSSKVELHLESNVYIRSVDRR